MKVPDKFPEGCVFGMDVADGDGVELMYVELPGGKRFVLNEKSPWEGMLPTDRWPLRWSKMSEEEFLAAARATL